MQNETFTNVIAEYMHNIEGLNIPADIIEAAIKALVAYYTEAQKN